MSENDGRFGLSPERQAAIERQRKLRSKPRRYRSGKSNGSPVNKSLSNPQEPLEEKGDYLAKRIPLHQDPYALRANSEDETYVPPQPVQRTSRKPNNPPAVSSMSTMGKRKSKKLWVVLGIGLLLAVIVFVTFLSRGSDSTLPVSLPIGKTTPTAVSVPPMLNPHGTYMGWLSGKDCTVGKNAYQDRVARSPRDVDEAMVGNEWLNPNNGQLIQSNNCDKKDMSDVIDLVHKYGGHVYVTLTVDGSFSSTLTADYIQKAVHDDEYIRNIINGIGNADGLITDIERVAKQSGIADAYTQFNNRLKAAVHAQNDNQFGGKKFFGMALIHKVNDDEFINGSLYVGFQDWRAVADNINPDIVTILAQDENYIHPGPLATPDWLGKIVLYTDETMHSMLPKIVWTVFNYGWLWTTHDCSFNWQHADSDSRLDGHAPLVTYQEMQKVLIPGKSLRPTSNLGDSVDPTAQWVENTCDEFDLHATTVKSFGFLMNALKAALKVVLHTRYSHFTVAVWWDTTEAPAKLDQVPALK